jgi:hypothetical protein
MPYNIVHVIPYMHRVPVGRRLWSRTSRAYAPGPVERGGALRVSSVRSGLRTDVARNARSMLVLFASAVACSTAALGEPIGSKANPLGLRQTGKNVEGGDPTVSTAQISLKQPATKVSQIFYNIVTDGGAACNGDSHIYTGRTTSITSGTKILTVTTGTFVSGDAGKTIVVPGMNSITSKSINTIRTVDSPTQVTLVNNSLTTLSSVSKDISVGTDDGPSFRTFNTWALANQGSNNQVVLTIPNGAVCWFGSPSIAFAKGIKNLIGRFSVGKWIMIGGVDQQGTWNTPFSFPPNARYFEWRQITAICNNTGPCSGTATITLDRPLTNSYLDTWPQWNSGNAFEVDSGGPATIYVLDDSWNTTVEYRGLTINQTIQTYAVGRNVTYRNVTFGGFLGGIPTQNETWTAISSSWRVGTVLETDKLVGTMTMDNVSVPRIDFQSSSTDLFVLKNSNVKTIFGTPTRTEITDTSLGTFRPGATGYGETFSVVCTRCNVTAFETSGGVITPQSTSPFTPSMSAGVFSWPNTDEIGPYPTGIVFVPPRGNVYWRGAGMQSVGLFNVQTLTRDATNAYAQTNEVGGLPPIAGGITSLRTHPAQQFTCTDPDPASDPIFISVCTNAGATASAPLGTYGSRTYAPSAAGNIGKLKNRGKLVSLTIDVTTPSTHTSAITLNATGQYVNTTMDQTSWTTYNWVPQINLKQAGTRVITPSGITCNGSPGACAGDACVQPASGCFSLPSAIWFGDEINPYVGGTFSGGVNPQFSITLRTDQGVVN